MFKDLFLTPLPQNYSASSISFSPEMEQAVNSRLQSMDTYTYNISKPFHIRMCITATFPSI